MIEYIVKSGICLGLLLAFYHLVLEREKMHHFNRFYLLGSVLFSLLIPLYTIYIQPSSTFKEFPNISEPITISLLEESPFTLSNFIWGSYLLICGFLIVRFIKNILDIFLKISKNQKLRLNQATLVLVQDKIVPHTFWNYIFVNKKEFQKNQIEDELYTHEITHVT